MRMKTKYLLFVAILVFSACQQQTKTQNSNESASVSEQQYPEGFEEFFDRFHKDSVFQLSHIVFPLEGKQIKDEQNYDFLWPKENWVLHKAFDENLTDFEKTYQVINNIVIETIRDKYNFSKIERRFAKLGDEWMLIYYAIVRI